jgi:hypothetical protein
MEGTTPVEAQLGTRCPRDGIASGVAQSQNAFAACPDEGGLPRHAHRTACGERRRGVPSHPP